MLKRILLPLTMISLLFSGTVQAEQTGPISFSPIEHASFVMRIGGKTIYIDPVGNPSAYDQYQAPDLILITDIHRDHLDKATVDSLKTPHTTIIVPESAHSQLKEGTIMNNGENKTIAGIKITAIPMYNLTEDRLDFHPRGRGNGYLLEASGKTVYISGDTEDVPEMRALKNLDYAVICMNLPYTMNVGQAASAVLAMKPAVVIPYHYRGKDGYSDLEEFSTLVATDKSIEVRLLDWYK